MNKITKKIILASVIVAAFGGGIWYYSSRVQTPIYDFDFTRDTEPILDMFKKDWYWLDASRDEYAPEYVIYKLKNRTPHINPLYTGTMRIKVLRENNQLVGFITYHKEGADSGRILYLGVHAEMRGKRYGELLARYAIDDLIAMGSKKIRLVTRTDNLAAQKLYTRLGFVETSRSDGFVSFEYIVK